jgi:Relaxase/Mobilisation nuclease domain
MISKICTGHSFRGAILYVCKESKHAQIITSEGVRDHVPKLMIQDFELQQNSRPEKNQACFHGILSFYPGENPGDDKIQEIALKYLSGLNIRNTQYAVIKHTDKAHIHVHLIANLVDNNGKSISDQWIGLRGKKLGQKLTEEFKLTQSVFKDLSKIHYANLRTPEKHKMLIYAAIKNHLREARSLDELEDRLFKLGITMHYKYKCRTSQKQGVSFKLGKYAFKGSEIDRNFSYSKLENTISVQNKQSPLQQINLSERPSVNLIHSLSQLSHNSETSNTISSTIQKTLEQLLRQEQEFERIPYEISQISEIKRRQRRHRL